MSAFPLTPERALPADCAEGALVGRVWRPDVDGPSVVALRGAEVVDISRAAPTMRDLVESGDPAALARTAPGEVIGTVSEVLANTRPDGFEPTRPRLLAPCDLQPVKAAGVTFARSLVERVIEEKTRGRPEEAAAVRAAIGEAIGHDLRAVTPGSAEAMALKETLVARGLWSQYLEVGIGPDVEVFTKAQAMSAVGTGADVGINAISRWNNPEPEVVLAVTSKGRIVGAALGNDVNLRDVEGRSALLLGKAKDNNASAAIGPFLRLFDEGFTLDDVRRAEVTLTVEGADGFHLQGKSLMAEISRDPEDIVRQTIGAHHQYPDGFMLYLGTLFAPTEDRDAPGQGFTHHQGDLVTIASPQLGALVNRVTTSDRAPPWTFGTAALMRNLAQRGLL